MVKVKRYNVKGKLPEKMCCNAAMLIGGVAYPFNLSAQDNNINVFCTLFCATYVHNAMQWDWMFPDYCRLRGGSGATG